MIYTVWEKVNTETYRFYMAAEDSTVAIQSAPIDAVITETELWFTFNYMTADELAHYKLLHWLPVISEVQV